MSGRGRGYRGGRSSHRGGRGRGRSNRSSSQKSLQAAKLAAARKTLADHVHSIGSAKQASNCTVITQFIINHVRKTFECGDDIGDALEKRIDTAFPAPILQPATATDAAAKALEEKQNKILYRAEVATYVAQKDNCQANEGKAYALLFGQCNKAMQHKLQLTN